MSAVLLHVIMVVNVLIKLMDSNAFAQLELMETHVPKVGLKLSLNHFKPGFFSTFPIEIK